jgi:hypothetical protein
MRRTHIGLALSVSTLLAVLILTEHGGTIQTHAASPILNRIPTDCPTGSPRTVLGKVFGTGPSVAGYGAFPVAGLAWWATCHPPVQYERPSTTPVMAAALWLDTQDAVVHEPRFGRVTLRGSALHGRGPVWFILMVQGKSDADPLLDPLQAIVPGPRGSWPQFPGYMYVPHAGCYSIVAQWSGGHETIAFAAGQ